MGGYPIAWDYEAKGPSSPFACPYTEPEMVEYLFGCHYHYSTTEAPLQLENVRFVRELDTRDRRFWLWQIDDQFERTWNVIIGTGKSPFFRDTRHCHRWMYAEEAEQEDADVILLRASSQHPR